jgi:eukaryotic-like serine/threonine-protein kinase
VAGFQAQLGGWFWAQDDSTRVVVRLTAVQRPALAKSAEAAEEPRPSSTAIGPYHVLANLGTTADGTWHQAYDPRLFRKVWLHVLPIGTSAVTPARQNVARPGRLRWLAGRRGPHENWDAFEAPTGQPLWQLLEDPHDWSSVRFWLLDLAEELAASLKDDTLPASLGLDHVWVTAEGRAILLDQETPGGQAGKGVSISTQAGEVKPPVAFLHLVAAAALQGRRLEFAEAQADKIAVPLPLDARAIVDGLKKAKRPEVVAAQIEPVLSRPTRIGNWRRGGILACCIGIPFIFSLLPLLGMLMFRALEATPERELQMLLEWHSPDGEWATPPSDDEKKAVEIYLAGTHRDRISDPATWDHPLMKFVTPKQREVAEDIVARTPPPAEEALQNSRQVVTRMIRPGDELLFDAKSMLSVTWFMFVIATVIYFAIPSLFCALAFRGGLLWWIFGITAVRKDGQPAGRLRIFARNLIAWSPIFLLPIAWAMLSPLLSGLTVLPNDLTVPAVCVTIAYAAVTLASTFGGKRTWPDRLAGTWLVLR